MGVLDFLKSALMNVAPGVATVIGGPAAGAAVSALSNLFFGHSNGTPDEIAQAIQNATPEQIMQLKQMDLEYTKLQLQNVQDARAREIEITKAGGNDTFKNFLGYSIVIGVFAIIFMMFFRPVEEGLKDLIIFALGNLIGCLLNMTSYYWGSSLSSSIKDKQLNFPRDK